MNKEAQRIAIAEACGWVRGPDAKIGDDTWPVWNKGSQCGSLKTQTLPDYLNDLNAMQSADRCAADGLMNADQWEEYGRNLERQHPKACLDDGSGKIDYYDFASIATELTAAQRAEAFLRTLGKWEES